VETRVLFRQGSGMQDHMSYPELSQGRVWADGWNVDVGARPGHAPCRCWGMLCTPRRACFAMPATSNGVGLVEKKRGAEDMGP
jgi:hypothetical protein